MVESVTSSVTSVLALAVSFRYAPAASPVSSSKKAGTSRAATSFMAAWSMDVWTSSFFFRSRRAGRDSTAAERLDESPPAGSLAPPLPPEVLLRIACSLAVMSCNSAPLLSIASGNGLNLCRP